ncbi:MULTISPECIES: ribbon-helix-helix protein, CopG family [Stenotrophomonas]|uniref:ribbon-helix-helix protein, CopG family n=1 Tax=Stenotrophomonas TaxID=40323 RepID=UPI001F06449E|nr:MULTISPECIES: ribbon-helix-helix protein, CopG family [Stenotrophomonas]MCH1909769.1 ribbon-helix-helix domain-containing protein [Stenotrophomonas sp. Y6]
MGTTTIRLPDELKARVAEMAKETGMTPHGFILEAIAEKAALAQRRADFEAEAERRHAGIAASGKTIPWNEMRSYLERRVAGQTARRPAARKLAE